MFYSKFQIGFFIRIVLLTLSIGLLLYWLFIDIHYLRCIYVLIIIFYLIWSIFHNLNRISRDFQTFISALANEEYAIQFTEDKTSGNLQALYHLYNTTANRFQKVKYERDLQHLFLEEILNQIEVGILSFDHNERILLLNRASKHLFGSKKPQTLRELPQPLYEKIKDIEPGNRKLVYYSNEGENLVLSTHSTSFVIKGKSMTLMYFHNIKSEMDEQELESWQKLFSVLTHEIMNSVTPISSLSSSLQAKLRRDISEYGSADPKTINLLMEGLDAVNIRTAGLLSFTDSFRKISKIPKPKIVEIDLEKLLERIQTLFSSAFQKHSIEFRFNISSDSAIIFGDIQQLEQVFINLIQNSIDSLSSLKNGTITIASKRIENRKTEILISDNGKGIPENIIDRVFIPFFTTKEKGSGIGLSLCRQIVRMHGGSIEIKSFVNSGTTIIIRL